MKKAGAVILGILIFCFVCSIFPGLCKIIMGLFIMLFNIPPNPRVANVFESVVSISTLLVAALAARLVYRAIVKPETTHKSFKFSWW